MLLGAPPGKRVETINNADGFVSNFWRSIAKCSEDVAHHADWPVNETDLFARHSWLVRQTKSLTERLHADPDWFDVKIAGWWCWGACNWIGTGWCSGDGPWVNDGERIVKRTGEGGVRSQLPHLSSGQGINRTTEQPRRAYIMDWFALLHERLRDVRVTCGDWSRVVKDSVTTRHGLTGVFLDPPYTKGAMDYAAGGVGGALADEVRAWCLANGDDKLLRIVLCGHAGEHDELLAHGWHIRTWAARKGYALSDEAVQNSKDETLWCSPHCVPEVVAQHVLFS